MAIDLDELLRTQPEDLVDESRGPLEDMEQDVQRRVGRRRRRRRVGAGCGVLAVPAVVLAAPTMLGERSSPDVSTNVEAPATTDPPLAPARPVGVERIDAYGGLTGTARIVVHFDAPVPTDAPMYVDDIEHPDAPGIAYTTQDPTGLKVCQNTHWLHGDEGTVDVLIPTAWLEPGTRGSDIPLETHDKPGEGPRLRRAQRHLAPRQLHPDRDLGSRVRRPRRRHRHHQGVNEPEPEPDAGAWVRWAKCAVRRVWSGSGQSRRMSR